MLWGLRAVNLPHGCLILQKLSCAAQAQNPWLCGYSQLSKKFLKGQTHQPNRWGLAKQYNCSTRLQRVPSLGPRGPQNGASWGKPNRHIVTVRVTTSISAWQLWPILKLMCVTSQLSTLLNKARCHYCLSCTPKVLGGWPAARRSLGPLGLRPVKHAPKRRWVWKRLQGWARLHIFFFSSLFFSFFPFFLSSQIQPLHFRSWLMQCWWNCMSATADSGLCVNMWRSNTVQTSLQVASPY